MQLLKEGDGTGFGVAESRICWVKEEDVPALMQLLDAAYDKLRFDGACEGGLLDALGDTREMTDPRQAPPYDGFTIADAALFILLERRSIGLDQVLPRDMAARIEDRGVYAYFEYVTTPEGRRDVVERVERLVAK